MEGTEARPHRIELTKRVGDMLKYLNSEEDLKNGYHLAEVLTLTRFGVFRLQF